MKMIDVVPDTCIFCWLSEPCEDCSSDVECSMELRAFQDMDVSLLMRVSSYFNP